MITLPKKEEELVVDMSSKVPGLKARMRTLSDGEAAKMMSGRVVTSMGENSGDTLTLEIPQEALMQLFRRKFVAFEGESVQIGEELFSPKNPAHFASLPLDWKAFVMQKLITYASENTSEQVLGN